MIGLGFYVSRVVTLGRAAKLIRSRQAGRIRVITYKGSQREGRTRIKTYRG